jgi:hypothetical protein
LLDVRPGNIGLRRLSKHPVQGFSVFGVHDDMVLQSGTICKRALQS